MLKRFEKQYKWGNTALIYYVSPQGEIQVYNLSRGKQNPVFIQVVFENNRASFADNTEWLASVTRHMKEYYQMNTINRSEERRVGKKTRSGMREWQSGD